MRAVTITDPGGPESLVLTDVADPVPGPGEVVIAVAAAGVNRADVLQRRGFYAPPPGASPLPGLEVSGVVDEVGEGVTAWRVGDEVCAVLAGGGYAERVAVPAEQVLPVPDGVSLVDAAALPEVACTVASNLDLVAGCRPGETLLVHGGASGIGTHAIQWAVARGMTVLTTVGSAEKARIVTELGATRAIRYREEDFADVVADVTGGRGVDVVLDIMGAKYLRGNVASLAVGGRLVVIGLQGGARAELDLGALLAKRATVVGTTLRARPVHGRGGKAEIVAHVVATTWPLVAAGRIRPVVDRTYPLADAAQAHRHLDGGEAVGKTLLIPGEV